jgi:hypothetical protein
MSNMDDVQYSDGPTLLDARGDIDVTVVNGAAYISGGFTHENGYSAPYGSVEMLDMVTQTWSAVDALNDERGDKQLVTLNGKVYAIGGETKVDQSGGAIPEEELPHLGETSTILDSIEVYDPNEDVHGDKGEWKSLDDMPTPLFRFSAAGWETTEDEGVIFVFGGQVGFDPDCECFRTTDKVMVFDPSKATGGVGGSGTASDSAASSLGHGCVVSLVALGMFWLAI